MHSFFRKIQSVCLSATLLFLLAVTPAWAAKNVIIMVADGAGYNTWLAASMYQGRVGKQVYDQHDWVRLSAATYPLNRSTKPTGNLEQDKKVIYDPFKAWDATRIGAKPSDCAGYAYLKSTPTDSAAAATALASGQKTYNNAINWDNMNEAMAGETIAEIAKAKGKAAGTISSVQWSHATPAGLGGAHNISRNKYAEIANEMLDGDWLNVIMGAGNPDFDNEGKPKTKHKKDDHNYVGGKKTWEMLKSGKHLAGWKLIQTKEEFLKLADGLEAVPEKLVGTVQTAATLQESRTDGQPAKSDKKVRFEPYQIPFNENVPSLAVMSKAAIRVLEQNPRGFYLIIEGGAVDWANHANKPERTIEEQIDFVQAVEAVVAWVEQNSNWDDTLLILTADHECGHLWGPDSDKIPFQPLVDNGPGKVPGMKHNYGSHTNSLVPIYARGTDAELFHKLIKGKDAKAAAVWNISGEYVENTDIFQVMKAAMEREAKK